MEAWSGVKLQNSAVYGIRVYRRGSTLFNHVDRSDTHIISAILNVDQKVGGLASHRHYVACTHRVQVCSSS